MSDADMPPAEPTPAGDRDASRAWVSVVLIPVFLIVALIIGFVLTGALEPDTGTAPVWQDLIVGLVVLALVAIPCLAAIGFGRRAQALDEPRGRVPAAVGTITLAATAVLILGTVLYNAVS